MWWQVRNPKRVWGVPLKNPNKRKSFWSSSSYWQYPPNLCIRWQMDVHRPKIWKNHRCLTHLHIDSSRCPDVILVISNVDPWQSSLPNEVQGRQHGHGHQVPPWCLQVRPAPPAPDIDPVSHMFSRITRSNTWRLGHLPYFSTRSWGSSSAKHRNFPMDSGPEVPFAD